MYGILGENFPKDVIMNRLKLLLALLALLVSTLACATLFGDESYSDEGYYTDEVPGLVTDEAPAQDYEPSTGSVSGADSCQIGRAHV